MAMPLHSSYSNKICVYDEHPIAGRDIQYQAPDSQSRNQWHSQDNEADKDEM